MLTRGDDAERAPAAALDHAGAKRCRCSIVPAAGPPARVGVHHPMQESTRHLKSSHDTPANGLENPTDRATVDCGEFSLAQHSNLTRLRSRLAAGHRFLLLSVARIIAATRLEATDGDVGSVPWGT